MGYADLAKRLDGYADHFQRVGCRNMEANYLEIVEKGKLDLQWALDFREAANLIRRLDEAR